MNLHKLSVMALICGGMAAAGVVNAADQGSGTVTFTGSVIDAPCSIDTDSAKQDVDMGSISLDSLKGGGESEPATFSIKLKGCSVATSASVTTTFTGAEDSQFVGAYGFTGGTAKGAAVKIYDNNNVAMTNGQAGSAVAVQEGDNELGFTATVIGGAGTTAGDFSAVTNFELAYE